MNRVKIVINSYAQQASLYINGSEPSPYSELANYRYDSFLKDPGTVLSAVAREINDEFSLSVCGNPFEVALFAQETKSLDFCTECIQIDPPVCLTSQQRAEILGDALPVAIHNVYVDKGDRVLPLEALQYGRISISFCQAEPDSVGPVITVGGNSPIRYADSAVTIPYQLCTAQFLAAICETVLVNPIIGKAAVTASTPEKAVCCLLMPLLAASMPEDMEVGTTAEMTVKSHPDGVEKPAVVLSSSNPDVLAVEGIMLNAVSAGTAIIQAFTSGENSPFFSQKITAYKHVYVSSIEIEGLDAVLCEGFSLTPQAKVIPADAEDASSVIWESSDPNVADFQAGALHLNKPGSCTITAKTRHASVSKKVTIVPKLRSLKITEPSIRVNVGRKVPIVVNITPTNAHNAFYTWKSTDSSVAIAEKDEDGRDILKAVGIGTCKLTCTSADNAIQDTCDVIVESIMYNRKPKRKITNLILLLAVALIALFAFVRSCGSSLGGNPASASSPAPEESAPPTLISSAEVASILNAGVLDDLCVQALDDTQEVAASEADGTCSEPIVVAAYFVTVQDLSVPYQGLGDVEFSNAVAIATQYAFELDTHPGEYYDRLNIWLFPNWTVSADGSVDHVDETVYRYYARMTDADQLLEWFDAEFWSQLSVTELPIE